MIRPFPARGVFALLCTLLATAAFGHDREVDTRLTRHLDDDVRAARITRDESIAHKLSAILAPNLLPEQYRGELPHCGTGVLLELFRELEEAEPRVRDFAAYALGTARLHGKQPGPDAESLPEEYRALSRELLRHGEIATNAFHSTPHFNIHYETGGVDAFAFVDALALGNDLETAWTMLVDRDGFTAPVSANASGLIDVVVRKDVPCPLADVPFCFGLAGAAVPPLITIQGYQGPTLFIKSTLGTTTATTAAHEFFHLLQYQGAGLLVMGTNLWWCEGSAVAVEDTVFPSIDHYIRWLDGRNGAFLDRTHEPIHQLTYESVLYHKLLMEKYSGGTAKVLREALNDAGAHFGRSLPGALEVVLPSYGTSRVDAFKHFALWNFHTGPRHDMRYAYADGSAFPEFTNFQNTHTLGSSVPSLPVKEARIEGSSSHYYRFLPDASLPATRKLILKVKTFSLGWMRGWVVVRRPGGAETVHDLTNLDSNNSSSEHEIVIDNFSKGTADEVVLILANGHENVLFNATYEARLNPATDIAFVIDTTGSMSSSITALKTSVLSALQLLNLGGADFRIAVTEFKDHPVAPYGDATDFPYRADSAFSNQQPVIQAGLNMLVARGGNDWPESQYSGILGAINAVNITPWRAEAQKSIIIMTDAPPHDPEPVTGYTKASVIAAANAGGISFPGGLPTGTPSGSNSASIVRRPNAVEAHAGNPIRIYGIVVGSDGNARNALTQLADGTGGKVYSATYSVNDIVKRLLEVVGDIGEEQPPVNRPPDAASAIGTPSPIWPANNRMAPVVISNITDPDGDTFTIRVTGVTQDEPVNAKNQGRREPDATGVGTGTASVRAERDGDGNGRVYVISFTATDSRGASAGGSVAVCVPHDQGGNSTCTDDGQAYLSTEP